MTDMTRWKQGYLADSPYPLLVQRELAPVWLGSVLTALGQRAPAAQGSFRYCELGCGQGLNSLLLAAAHPQAAFVAVDFNPQHIVHGRRLAQAAGLENLDFIQADFAELAQEEGAASFDYIALHGVYSWVSPDNRAAIRRYVARRLKPGGVLYLAYMSHPGMSAMATAQRLLWEYAQRAGDDPGQRLQAGLALLRQWQAGGAGYFVEHPDVARRLAHNEDEDLAYLVHELLCEHWMPLHSAQVIDDFAAIDCQFIGSATPLENIDALSLPASCLALLQDLQGPGLRETAKDIARNQSQRRDIFQRSPQPLNDDQHRQALLEGFWSPLPAAATTPVADDGAQALVFDTRIGPVQGDVQLFGPLLQALAEKPQSFAELALRPALAAQVGNLNSALQMLLWAGHAHPVAGTPASLATSHRLNRLLAEGALQGQGYRYLVAPGLGAGWPAGLLEMAAARVLLEHPQLRGRLLQETVLALLRRSEAVVPDQAGALLQRFEQQTLPLWLQLGVVG